MKVKDKTVQLTVDTTMKLLPDCTTIKELQELLEKFAEIVYEAGYDQGWDDGTIDAKNI